MSYPFYFNNKSYQLENIEVSKEQYNRWIKNCSKNISKSSIIYFDKTIRKKICLIDGKLYCGAKDCIDYFHEVVEESEELAKKYEEVKEWCISNFFAVENKTLPQHLAVEWIKYCGENKGSDLLCDAFKEINKRKEKIFQQKQKIENRKHKKEMKEKEAEQKKKIEQLKKEELAKKYEEEKQKENDAVESEEEEYEYNACSLKKVFYVRICVAGGGMMNGNANAYIEGEWETEEDFNNGEDGHIYYCEYGSNPCRNYVGDRIVWGEDDNFNIE